MRQCARRMPRLDLRAEYDLDLSRVLASRRELGCEDGLDAVERYLCGEGACVVD
jgi:hypothetical protein